ncbi:MAG: glutamine synthetase III [Candidatus Omnitrophica bacterium]|nr:glutamine synthetase III [Candidatus Omnitrophota bacterium]
MITVNKNAEELAFPGFFGEDVFSLKVMRNMLSEKAYKSLSATIKERKPLSSDIADEVADAMKTWAVSKGATHFTHWFLPLTEGTAEKHDSFIFPDEEGGAMLKFSGRELLQGEPDASSFPSGGLRATFEARGYTGWDPTSPAFIRHGKKYATLCIPSFFCAYNGQALCKKTPLLRSMEALSKQVCRLGKLFGLNVEGKRAYVTLGPEQEYFLIDRKMFAKRLDLIQTGRTLFGRRPAKHQQMEDHYFGAIKPRVMAFMEDVDSALWRWGIPARTRHNEVAPAQFEIAPVYEELNLGVDHNMLVMEVLRAVAEKHDMACLLHEKPFAGINGSGKHNNWSIVGPDGKNWLTPGETPHENAKFITLIAALMKAVHTYAPMLRAAVASAGNDHRLGANEAPPAIMSIFLGEQLTDILEQIEKGGAKTSKKYPTIEIGVSSLPTLPKDVTDRNRTSPFAFTGNKFEFRAVGSSMSCAGPNIVMNTIMADALDGMCARLESDIAAGKNFNDALQTLLKETIAEHKNILFNGDNYCKEWHDEAAKRGLPNIKTTVEAINAVEKDETIISMFERHKVLSPEEFESRNTIYKETYERIIKIEAETAVNMARTMVIPAAVEYQSKLAEKIHLVRAAGRMKQKGVIKLLERINGETEAAIAAMNKLEERISKKKEPKEVLSAMVELRKAADNLEGMVPKNLWPLPSYAEMLF